jgi:hypothetical protein
MSEESWRPPLDVKIAAQYIGKYVLIGITYQNFTGEYTRQEQMHGRIVDVCEKRGFLVDLKGVNDGRKYVLPPDMRSMKFAEPGEYTLRETNEVVSDPDLLCSWIITENIPHT